MAYSQPQTLRLPSLMRLGGRMNRMGGKVLEDEPIQIAAMVAAQTMKGSAPVTPSIYAEVAVESEAEKKNFRGRLTDAQTQAALDTAQIGSVAPGRPKWRDHLIRGCHDPTVRRGGRVLAVATVVTTETMMAAASTIVIT